MRDLIHFTHGNGLPAMCYKQMFDHLESRFDYCYIDKLGHDPLFPVDENWHNLTLEVLASVTKQANKPVIAVGHSLGGILSLLAAIEAPELFKAVIMLDSPLIGGFKSNMVQLAKRLGFIERLTPAYRTRFRVQHWKNYNNLVHYLKSKEMFNTFSDECLEDYIAYATELKEDGYHLIFDRSIEAQIFRTIPHTIPKYIGKLLVPSALIYGDKSKVVDRMDLRYMKKHFNVCSYKIKGTHLFPMEHPKAAAELITETIDAIINL